MAEEYIEVHPLAKAFPVIKEQEFDDLVADIKAHGVREPIWLYEGQILDGRNRYTAAGIAGVDCPTRTYEGDDPVAFGMSRPCRVESFELIENR
jgi:ParB-like chromosome segregation protein Spo0J